MNRTLSPPRYSFWQLSAIRHDRLRVERRAHLELSRQPYKLTSSTGPELPANRRNARSNGPWEGFAFAYRSRVRPLNTGAVRLVSSRRSSPGRVRHFAAPARVDRRSLPE